MHDMERKIDMQKPEQNKRFTLTNTPYMFIPKRLDAAERSETSHFPVNVLFVSFRSRDGRLQAGSALYEPDFDTYHRKKHLHSMRYRNVYGGGSYLVVTYDEENRRYRGEKSINGTLVGSAGGGDWQSFFT